MKGVNGITITENLLYKNHNIMVISISGLFLSFAMGFLRWYLPIKLTLMGNAVFAGICFAVANVDDTIFSFLGGILADKRGRKPIIILSTLFYSFGALFFLISLYFPGSISLLLIFVATVFLWGVTGLSSGATSALIAESEDKERVGRAFSTYSVFSNMGTIFGSFTLSIMLNRSGIFPVAYLILLATGLGVVVRTRLNETLQNTSRDSAAGDVSVVASIVDPLKTIKGTTFIVPILILVILNGLAFGVSGQFYSVYVKEILKIDEIYIGSMYSLIPLLQLGAQPVAGYVTDRFGAHYSLMVGNCVTGIFIVMFCTSFNIPFAIAALVASYVLGPFHGIGYRSLIAKVSSQKYMATLYGGLLSIWNAMFIFGPLMGGVMYFNLPPAPFIFTGALLLLAVVPILKIRK